MGVRASVMPIHRPLGLSVALKISLGMCRCTRAEASTATAKGHQMRLAAVPALQVRKAPAQHAAGQKAIQLGAHELRHRRGKALLAGAVERGHIVGHHLVQGPVPRLRLACLGRRRRPLAPVRWRCRHPYSSAAAAARCVGTPAAGAPALLPERNHENRTSACFASVPSGASGSAAGAMAGSAGTGGNSGTGGASGTRAVPKTMAPGRTHHRRIGPSARMLPPPRSSR